jgi:hypothetical protein
MFVWRWRYAGRSEARGRGLVSGSGVAFGRHLVAGEVVRTDGGLLLLGHVGRKAPGLGRGLSKAVAAGVLVSMVLRARARAKETVKQTMMSQRFFMVLPREFDVELRFLREGPEADCLPADAVAYHTLREGANRALKAGRHRTWERVRDPALTVDGGCAIIG